ncbi:MAG: hypothetical protein Kow00109_18820 [Acidobacteriota bacterium]
MLPRRCAVVRSVSATLVALWIAGPLGGYAGPFAVAAQAGALQAAGDPSPRVVEADQALAAGKFSRAAELYREELAQRPDEASLWVKLGMALHDGGRPGEAIAAFRRYVELMPEVPDGWVFLGLSEYAAGYYDAALADLSRGLRLGIPNSRALRGIAGLRTAALLNRRGAFEEALQLLSVVGQFEENDEALIETFGAAVLRIRALPAELPAKLRGPADLAGRGALAMTRGKNQEARQYFDTLVERYPEARGVHYARAAFLSQDDPETAVEEFRKELEHHPDFFDARLRLGNLLWQLGRFREAREEAEAAVRLDPESVHALFLLGRVYISLGEPEEAIRWLEEARVKAPDSSRVLVALQQAYARAGRTEQAEALRRQLLRQAPGKTGTPRAPGHPLAPQP